MKIPCYSCKTETELEVGFDVVNFACPSCQTLYTVGPDGRFYKKSQYNTKNNDFALQLGDVGLLKGSEYRVVGILRKNVHPDYSWSEFILQNDAKEFLYLSLSDGHWILLSQMDEIFNVQSHPEVLEYENKQYDIFEDSDATIINAQGFFDFDLTNHKKMHLVEYIRPPYMISVEKANGSETAFYGEYVKKEVIKKAFKKSYVPYQVGVNMIQPAKFNVRNTGIIFCFFALLILTVNWYVYKDQAEKNVFSKTIKFSEFNNKDFTTDSFVLEGASAPMTVRVSTGVDNSWANVNMALINEDTSEEIYASKDIEYYHGNTDGESWTEGNASEKFNICGVKAGKYHFVITPAKAPEDKTNAEMQVSAVWSQPSNRNLWFVIIFMGIIFFIIRYFTMNFENRRWADSSYSD
ncbi:DUF4178 domain-containing protein [Flavobacterium procerum]|uniref:DUF4178 domain-containing protein n=1 Tax=Flavobacterium procerum TaxID=1455569 RepID=A0ABV6BX80_9FLAO